MLPEAAFGNRASRSSGVPGASAVNVTCSASISMTNRVWATARRLGRAQASEVGDEHGMGFEDSRTLPPTCFDDTAAAATACHSVTRAPSPSTSSEQPQGSGSSTANSEETSRSASQPHPLPQRSGPGSLAESRLSTVVSCRSNVTSSTQLVADLVDTFDQEGPQTVLEQAAFDWPDGQQIGDLVQTHPDPLRPVDERQLLQG